MNMLPFCLAHSLAQRNEKPRWLIQELWSDQGVGILGGEPKSCKTFLALDMAVSVASGTPCLRRFSVHNPGRVLLYAAEDAPTAVHNRLEGISATAGVDITSLDIHVITAPIMRLDSQEDCSRLAATVAHLRPRLLILDPFVRLHRIDENISGEVAPLLSFLRDLQRQHQMAVVVVHHAKKAAGHARAGQALRGTSEFHAWGDSNLYLRHRRDKLLLMAEHRAAPPMDDVTLQLNQHGNGLALGIVNKGSEPQLPASSRENSIVQALAQTPLPMSRAQLRTACRMRTTTIGQLLAQMVDQGRIVKTTQGYCLAS